jgi:hypothetical protein
MVPLQHQSEAMQQKHCEPAPRHAPQLALSVQDIVAHHQLSLIQTRINWGHQLKLHRTSSDGQWRAATGIRVDGSIEEETVEGMVAVLAQLTSTPLGTPVDKVTGWGREEDFNSGSEAGDVSSGDDEIAWPPGIAHLRPPDSPSPSTV